MRSGSSPASRRRSARPGCTMPIDGEVQLEELAEALERLGPTRNRPRAPARCTSVDGLWLQDIESLEAISQDEDTRKLFLRMAHLSQNGRLQPFLRELEDDGELDAGDEGDARRARVRRELPACGGGLRPPHARLALASCSDGAGRAEDGGLRRSAAERSGPTRAPLLRDHAARSCGCACAFAFGAGIVLLVRRLRPRGRAPARGSRAARCRSGRSRRGAAGRRPSTG